MAFAGEKQSMVTAEKRSIIFTTVGMVIVIFAGFTVLAIVLAKKMSASLKKIDNALNETAEGSLSADTDAKSSITEIKNLIGATQTLQGKLQEIIRETSDIADELAENVGEMTEVTGTAADSSGQISNAVEDLSSGAVSLAENVQNISDKVMQMSEDIANIAEDVDRLNYASEKMKTASEISVEYMVKVADSSNESANGVSTIVKQVKDTNNAISKIDEAIEMISSITEQTNLLSLNASIEAARAGEAGKGFAVVADEIRNLATQSSNSADEISHIVSEIKAQSAATVQTSEHVVKLINDEQKFMEESKSKFGDMESGINSTIDYTQSIAARMSGLDEARKEIAGNVSDLGAISQENAASNEEVTSSVENIAGTIKTINQKSRGINEMSARLKGVISYFRG
jgi:methyl-accepting chemotaxis protein